MVMYSKNTISKKFIPIVDDLLNILIKVIKKDKKQLCSTIGIYTILSQQEKEYNNDNITFTQRANKYFGIDPRTLKKIFYFLEQYGFIVQEYVYGKSTGRLHITKYFEYFRSEDYWKHIKYLKDIGIEPEFELELEFRKVI